MDFLNLEALWSTLLIVMSYHIYDKYLKNTAFRKIGKLISLLLFIGSVLLLGIVEAENEYLYQLLKTIPAFFALNLFDKEDGRKNNE